MFFYSNVIFRLDSNLDLVLSWLVVAFHGLSGNLGWSQSWWHHGSTKKKRERNKGGLALEAYLFVHELRGT